MYRVIATWKLPIRYETLAMMCNPVAKEYEDVAGDLVLEQTEPGTISLVWHEEYIKEIA